MKFYTELDELIERNKLPFPFPYMIGLFIPYNATQVRIGCYPPEIVPSGKSFKMFNERFTMFNTNVLIEYYFITIYLSTLESGNVK